MGRLLFLLVVAWRFCEGVLEGIIMGVGGDTLQGLRFSRLDDTARVYFEKAKKMNCMVSMDLLLFHHIPPPCY